MQAESLGKPGKAADLGSTEQEVRKQKSLYEIPREKQQSYKQRSWLVFTAKVKLSLIHI